MVKCYDITQSSLSSKSFEAGAIYCCSDTGNVYIDSVTENERVKMSSEVVIVATDANLPLAPIPDTLYIVLSTRKMYIYNNGWSSLDRPNFIIPGVTVTKNVALEVSNSDILATSTARFVPDSSVADLVTSSTATCTAGKVTVSVVSNHDITGDIYIN